MGIDISGIDEATEDFTELQERLEDPEVAEVGASADHAKYVEFGTDPHTIEADDAEALHFEIDGESVFAQSVQHPGTKPQPFIRPARLHVVANTQSYAEQAETSSDIVQLAAIDAVGVAKRKVPVDDGDLRNSIRWEFK